MKFLLLLISFPKIISCEDTDEEKKTDLEQVHKVCKRQTILLSLLVFSTSFLKRLS